MGDAASLAATKPNFTAVSAASSGDNTLLAAQTDEYGNDVKIRVIAVYLRSVTAVAVRFESGAGGTALTGVMSMGATDDICLPHNPEGWFETAAGSLLNLELGGAVQVSGVIVWKKC